MRYLNTDTGEWIEFEWKTPYNHDTNAESDRTGLACNDGTLTQQHMEAEANINTIVRNFGVTGQLPQIPLPPSLEEFADIFDFQTAMNIQAAAKASFMMLAPEIREAFYNDPHNFVSQVDAMLTETDKAVLENNLAKLRQMGLAVQPGPTPDRTTLGDLLTEIKKQAKPPDGVPPNPPNRP